MADDAVTHEQIEHAFKPAVDLIARLPTEGMDGYVGRRAAEALRVAEDYAHQHREKIRPGRTETVSALDASVSLRGPALVWPWPWPRQGRSCAFPSTHCSCGSTNQGG